MEVLNTLAIPLPSRNFWADLTSAIISWRFGERMLLLPTEGADLGHHIRNSLISAGWCFDEILNGEALAFRFSDAYDMAESACLSVITPA